VVKVVVTVTVVTSLTVVVALGDICATLVNPNRIAAMQARAAAIIQLFSILVTVITFFSNSNTYLIFKISLLEAAMQLIVDSLKFSYDSVEVLKGVSFKLERSEILGIIGPNGSGKTTLLKCINRILKPKQGDVLFNDQKISSMERRGIARIFGYVPQNANYDALTVFDTVLMGRRPYSAWWCNEKDIEKVWQALSTLGIEQLAMRKISELSGGERQKVLIARALAQEAKVLLLDEPTNNLDIKHQFEIMNLIRNLVKEKGLAAITVLHDLNIASKYCDKIIMMKEGRIYAAGEVDSVITHQNIKEVFGVTVSIQRNLGKPHIIVLGI